LSVEALERDRRAREPAGVPAVECNGLTFRLGSHTAVDRVDLEVRAGEVFGLLGPNGAGKTTTIRVLTTLLPAAGGSARIFGLEVARNRMRVRRLLGYVPQMLSADASLTGRENVALFARLFDVPRRDRAMRVAEALATMGLEEADHLCERVALMHRGRLRAVGAPGELKTELGPDATLEDVFRHHTGERLEEGGDIRDVRGTRRTARRLA
jgi:ABC-type multidrug transport system ATPase subunit